MEKIVKDINKLVLKKIVEIVFVLGFIVLSNYLWHSTNTQNLVAAINTYHNLNYTNFKVEDPIDYEMFPMTDEFAMKNLTPCHIYISNETYTVETYKLILKISKESTIDYRFLHIAIDQAIYQLNDLTKQEEENAYIFVLDKNTIQGESKVYEIRLWLSTLADNESQGEELILKFDLKNETTKV